MSNVTLTINDVSVTVPKGSTVLHAATKAGFFIPTFCHAPELVGFGACRICVVEIQGMRNMPASCVTEATEGMVVQTESPAVMEARKTILELILSNHPQDCLTCEKNGQCLLQDYAFRYGVKGPCFEGEKHTYPLDESNPYIIRDLNKCILCGRCVRTCAQVKDRAVIDYTFRGFYTKIAPPMDEPLAESDCVSCARCVAVCPVGALTYKRLSGKGRSWEMQRKPITCTFCDNGCAFNLMVKGEKVVGVEAKAPALGRPLCLKGRLGLELLYCEQPEAPQLKKDGTYVEVSWAEALGLEGVLDKMQQLQGEQKK